MAVDLAYNYEETTAKIEKFSQQEIDNLREWTKGLDKSKFVPKDLSDKQLVLFYNACEFDMDRTKVCIEKYYQFRKNAPEFFEARVTTSDELKSSVEALEFSFLPERSVKGYDIIFHCLRYTEPSKYHLEQGVKLLLMTVDACLHARGPQPGFIFLFDMKGVKLGHLTRVSLSSLRKFFQYIQEAMPVRMREVHVMNTEPILDKLLMLIRPFMDKKLFELIKFHKKNEDLETFYETVIPRSALPPNYGGELPDTQTLHLKCMSQLQKLEPYFKAEEAQRKNAIPSKNSKSVEKSFKKLEID